MNDHSFVRFFIVTDNMYLYLGFKSLIEQIGVYNNKVGQYHRPINYQSVQYTQKNEAMTLSFLIIICIATLRRKMQLKMLLYCLQTLM